MLQKSYINYKNIRIENASFFFFFKGSIVQKILEKDWGVGLVNFKHLSFAWFLSKLYVRARVMQRSYSFWHMHLIEESDFAQALNWE